MIETVYAHLGDVRHRSDVVEYRVSQCRAKLKAPLAVLRGKLALVKKRIAFGTTVGTALPFESAP